jgi:hypothetical protein
MDASLLPECATYAVNHHARKFRRKVGFSSYDLQMCGRSDNLITRGAYPTLYRAMRLPASNFPPRYNIAPTDQVPIVRIDPRDDTRELVTVNASSHSMLSERGSWRSTVSAIASADQPIY